MDMNKLLSEAMKLQENLTSSQERLEKEVFEASMGGGAVKVSVKGSMEIEKIQKNRSLFGSAGAVLPAPRLPAPAICTRLPAVRTRLLAVRTRLSAL